MTSQSTELVAAFMLRHGFATGHGDNTTDLLGEMERQLGERDQKLEAAEADRDRARADLAEARKVIEPFAGEKLPNSRRIKIAYDRHGLRRAMSDLEIAQDAARAFIGKGGE